LGETRQEGQVARLVVGRGAGDEAGQRLAAQRLVVARVAQRPLGQAAEPLLQVQPRRLEVVEDDVQIAPLGILIALGVVDVGLAQRGQQPLRRLAVAAASGR
jgi:hypothetical protein